MIAGLETPPGLAINDELEAYYEGEIYHGRLYPNLDTLVEKGLVNKGTRDDRTNEYTLASRGRRELETRRDWVYSRVDPRRMSTVTAADSALLNEEIARGQYRQRDRTVPAGT